MCSEIALCEKQGRSLPCGNETIETMTGWRGSLHFLELMRSWSLSTLVVIPSSLISVLAARAASLVSTLLFRRIRPSAIFLVQDVEPAAEVEERRNRQAKNGSGMPKSLPVICRKERLQQDKDQCNSRNREHDEQPVRPCLVESAVDVVCGVWHDVG